MSNHQKAECIKVLKKTVKEFLIDMSVTIFKDEPEFVFVTFFFDKLSGPDLMVRIIDKVLPHKDSIDRRDEEFFVEQRNVIFNGLPQDKLDHFAKMCTTPYSEGGLSETDKQTVWSYFDIIIACADGYQQLTKKQ